MKLLIQHNNNNKYFIIDLSTGKWTSWQNATLVKYCTIKDTLVTGKDIDKFITHRKRIGDTILEYNYNGIWLPFNEKDFKESFPELFV